MMFCHFIWFLFGFFGDVFAVPSNVERTRIMMQIGQFQDDEEGGDDDDADVEDFMA